MRSAIDLRLAVLCVLAVLTGPVSSVRSEQLPAVVAGVQFLKGQLKNKPPGESAMIALALLKAEVPGDDPAVMACVDRFKANITTSGFTPTLTDGRGVYEASAMILALSNLDAASNRGSISVLTNYLTSVQKANGSWDYTHRTTGDCSISQYAVLGLWEAENSGIDISPTVWDAAAQWYMSVQSPAGGWSYHPDSAMSDTVSMTAAGVGSLLICQRQLERYRSARRGVSAMMTSIDAGTGSTRPDYKPQTTNARFKQAIEFGIQWLSSKFSPADRNIMGNSPFYGLYGIERVGALSDREALGRVDWYDRGKAFILGSQQPNGGWSGDHGPEMNTVWAMLFLTKSTKKTIQRITVKQLGGGTLLGGRYLPKDLTAMSVAGGRVVNRPMNGAIDGMISILEDPRAEKAESAFAGLVDRYYVEGAKALIPHRARFRKMCKNRDPGVRAVAVWALARTGELAVVPDLIAALTDSDAQVVSTARSGLQLISRKLEGLGPPEPSTPEERLQAANRWKEWFAAIRPLDLADPDDVPASTGPANKAKADPPAEVVTP